MTREELHRKTTELCSRLIRTRSYSGEESAVVAVLKEAMEELGYDEIRVDEYGSIIGCIRGSRPGPRILLDGHIDTVPVKEPERWSFDPFCGEVREDRVCGRGASDMKGAVAAMVCGAAYFGQNRDFPGEIYVSGVVYEELYEGIAARKISQAVQPDYVIIGEASELNLKIGQRGRAEIVVETIGKPAHSSNPEKGINAVKQMMKLLAALEGYQPAAQEGLGKAICELTDIISVPYPGASVVPERCIATFDRRLLVGETPQSILAPIQTEIDRLHEADPTFEAVVHLREETKVCYTGEEIHAVRFFPAWLWQKEDDFVKAAFEALAPLNPVLTNYSFCTNGSHYAGEAGIPTVGFGPSRENQAHTIDEYVLLSQLTGAADGYALLIGALTSMREEK